MVQDLLSVFDDVDGQYIWARVVTAERQPSTRPHPDALHCSLYAVVQDLLSAFDGVDGQHVRARVVTVEGQPHVAFALDAGRINATLAEHVRLLLPIW